MNKYLSKVFFFSSLLFVLAFLLDEIIDTGLSKSNYEYFNEWNNIIDGKINADLVISGSSRATRHVSPLIVDSVLGLNSYNLGMPAYRFYMQNTRYQVYRQNNKKPKIIIQILDLKSFEKAKELYQYEQFLPYLSNNMIKETTKNYLGLTWFDYNVPLYKYRSMRDLIKIGILEALNIKKYSTNTKYKGYNALNVKWDDQLSESVIEENIKIIEKSNYIKETSLNLFDDFLKKSKEEDIKVFLVYAPEYYLGLKNISNKEILIKQYKEFAQKYNFVFLDYSIDDMCKDKNLFYNRQHLNCQGAEFFSTKLCDDLKKILNSKFDLVQN